MRYFLDITADVCPMTFVKAKLMLERVPVGCELEIRLNAGEPLHNVPKSFTELGQTIESLEPENLNDPEGVHRLVVRKT